MADPLSGIASILAVVSALKAVEKAFRRCARNMAHAKEEVQRMGRGIAMFSDILRASQENLEKVPYGLFRSINARRSTKELLRECKRTIDQFWKFLRKLKPLAYDAAPAILSEIVAKWKWSSRKEEGRDLQSSLKGLEGSLAVWNSTILVNRKLAKLSREPADEELKQEIRFHKGQLDVALQVVKDVVRENKRLRHRDEALEHAKRIPVIFMIAVETADHQLEELQAQQSSQSSEGSYSIVDAPTGSPEAPLTGLPETPPTDHSITPSPDPPETAALDSFVLELGSKISGRRLDAPSRLDSAPVETDIAIERIATDITPTGKWVIEETTESNASGKRRGNRVRNSREELEHEIQDESSESSD